MAKHNDGWKDDLLAEPEISSLQLLSMPAERRQWVLSYPNVWVRDPDTDRMFNLTHSTNRKRAARYRKTHGDHHGR